MAEIAKRLARQKEKLLWRRHHVLASPQTPEQIIDDKKVIAFCSNDYLGLANHPQINQAFQEAINQWGTGAGAAHLVNGHSSAHQALEEELADWLGRDRALLFSTGYMANLAIHSAFAESVDYCLQDRLNHASLIDGAQLCKLPLKRYQHCNMDSFRQQLDDKASALIATDGVFSMDGDIAPLPQMVQLAREQKGLLMVDDAHGLGVLGEKGLGSLGYYGLNQQDVPILMGTLGKAFGTFGAFVAGSDETIETLIQFARSYIYTTASPPALAEATRIALELVQKENWRREQLNEHIRYFRAGAKQLGLDLMPSQTPIQPLRLGDSQSALSRSRALEAAGFLVSAIRPPTVPEGQARLRITLSAAHTKEQISRLLDTLDETRS